MKFFNFNKKEKEQKVEVPSTTSVNTGSLFQYNLHVSPTKELAKGKGYIKYGDDNLYPEYLRSLLPLSPTHKAIVTGKADMMAGKGFLINGSTTKAESKAMIDALDPATKLAYETFLDNPFDTLDINEIVQKVALDFQIENRYAIEVVWSLDFTKITRVKYIQVRNIREGEKVNDVIKEYFYSADWSKENKEGYIPKRIAAFDPNNKEDFNQLIYVAQGSDDHYGDPYYDGSLSWIDLEIKMSIFYNSLLDNGFNPNIIINFFRKPGPEQESIIVNKMNKKFQGTYNANKPMIFFSDDKETAPVVSSVQAAGIDKQYLQLVETATQCILTGGSVTSPMLFGITTSGNIGGQGAELETAYKIFNNSVIAPDRILLEKTFNTILKINKIPFTVTIEEFNPLAENEVAKSSNDIVLTSLNSLSPLVATKVLEAMTEDEIRALAALGPKPIVVTPPDTTINTDNPTQ